MAFLYRNHLGGPQLSWSTSLGFWVSVGLGTPLFKDCSVQGFNLLTLCDG